MKRLLLLSAAFLLGGALYANAQTITAYCTDSAGGTNTSTWTTPLATFNVTRTSGVVVGSNTYDELQINLAEWELQLPGWGSTAIESLVGRWTVLPASGDAGAYLYDSNTWAGAGAGGSATFLKPELDGEGIPTGNYLPQPAPRSFMDFTTKIDNAIWSRTASAALPAGKMYSTFYGGWYNLSSSNYVQVGGALATLYVTPGADVAFLAQNDGIDGIVTPVGTRCAMFTTQVPEPGTVALLCSGLVGLLCYAWRKRK